MESHGAALRPKVIGTEQVQQVSIAGMLVYLSLTFVILVMLKQVKRIMTRTTL
jgi:hypothetical protein